MVNQRLKPVLTVKRERTMTRRNQQRGFTLAEVLIVLAILGVLGAVAIPTIARTIPNYQVRAAARELVIDFKKAQVEAVKRGRTVLIQFTVATPADPGSYQVFVDMDGSGGFTAGDQLLKTVNMSPRIRMAATTFTGNTAGYSSRGFPRGNFFGNQTILQTADGTMAYTIALGRGGRVTIEE